MILMIYNLIFDFFLEVSLIYILESLLIPFYIFSIFYELNRIFGDRFRLISCLYILFYNLIVVSDIENASDFFLEKNLFLKKPLYLCVNDSQEIGFGP